MTDGQVFPDHDDGPVAPARGRSLPPTLVQRLLGGIALVTGIAGLLVALTSGLGPLPVALGVAIGLCAAGIVMRVRANRRMRAEQAGLVYLLGSRLAAAEAARARDAEILHELRSTVQGVSSASRLLTERSTEMSSEIAQRLEALREAELARLERLLVQSSPAVAGPVDIDDVVRPLVDSVELRGHRITWQPAGLQALGRPDDVAEIIHVLLENAVRHAPDSRISLHVHRTDDRVTVTVADSGPGVPSTLRDLVFDRGVRSSTSVGQGIGLNAALRLAHQMGGELHLVEDQAAPGAAFALDLPAAAGAPCHVRSA